VAHELCALLGVSFVQIIANVHPSLVDSNGEQPKSISNDTIAWLAKSIHSLREEKKFCLQKVWMLPKLWDTMVGLSQFMVIWLSDMGSSLQLQDLGRSLNELWKLMQTPLEEQQQFEHISCNIEVIEEDIMVPGSLVLDIIDR
jgi:protein regulator of cytokinesis 1